MKNYEFELSTSRTFTPNAVVWSSKKLKTPEVAVPISLPWITGAPYSLYAHVRVVTAAGVGPWSAPYGFNMRWPSVPKPMATYPGLVRWTPVEGASGYEVWFLDAGKVFSVSTNVADEREYFTFPLVRELDRHGALARPASRYLYGSSDNALPAVSFGLWSPMYTSTNPSFTGGPMKASLTVSDTVNTTASRPPTLLCPASCTAATLAAV